MKSSIFSFTCCNGFEYIDVALRENNFSIPPVSFKCIKRRVGGANSSTPTISVVSLN